MRHAISLIVATVGVASCAFAEATNEKTLYRLDFEDASMSGWVNNGDGAASWRNEAGVGRKGSRALVWNHSDTNTRPLIYLPLPKVKPGMIVEAECWVRADRYEYPGEGCPTFGVSWNDQKGRWHGGSFLERALFPPKTARGRSRYKAPEQDADGWSKLVIRTSLIQSDSAVPFVQFYAPLGATGRVRYDDVVIRIAEEHRVESFGCSAYQGRAHAGEVTFVAGICCDPNDAVRAAIEFKGSDGQPKSVTAEELTPQRATFKVPVSQFAPGLQNVRLSLRSSAGKPLGEAACAFTRTAAPDSRKVWIDAQGRCIVDGKPFFPLGMYSHVDDFKRHPELMDHYASGPFNCIQDYDGDLTLEEMDAFWAKGIRLIPSLIKYYAKEKADAAMIDLHPFKGIASRADEVRALGEYVNRIKDHPALLAWYVCDEMPLRWTPRLEAHTEFVRALDPDHPQWAVFCHMTSVGPMMNGYDVMGTDIYPIRARGCKKEFQPPDCANVWESTKAALAARDGMHGLRPQWQVPQAFNWGWDYPECKECGFPTAKEFRSMCWQHIAAGANGLIPYSYGQLVTRELGKPGFDKYWKIVTDAAAEVKSQIPVLLKDPGPKPASVPEKTLVRTWQDEASVYVLVTATHPEAVKGEIEMPGVGATAETLVGGGVTAKDGKLSVDLPPFGVAIVRLTFGGVRNTLP